MASVPPSPNPPHPPRPPPPPHAPTVNTAPPSQRDPPPAPALPLIPPPPAVSHRVDDIPRRAPPLPATPTRQDLRPSSPHPPTASGSPDPPPGAADAPCDWARGGPPTPPTHWRRHPLTGSWWQQRRGGSGFEGMRARAIGCVGQWVRAVAVARGWGGAGRGGQGHAGGSGAGGVQAGGGCEGRRGGGARSGYPRRGCGTPSRGSCRRGCRRCARAAGGGRGGRQERGVPPPSASARGGEKRLGERLPFLQTTTASHAPSAAPPSPTAPCDVTDPPAAVGGAAGDRETGWAGGAAGWVWHGGWAPACAATGPAAGRANRPPTPYRRGILWSWQGLGGGAVWGI